LPVQMQCAERAGTVLRNTRNEQVVGSIPTGGSEKAQLSSMIGDQVRSL
jgi:hypothetical protein